MTFHGTTFILSPVRICHTGNSSQTFLFSFLHQDNYCQTYTIDYKNNRQYNP